MDASRKRRRADSAGAAAGGGPADPRRRAAAISAKINAKYPYANFGRAYLRRGDERTLAEFGPTYRTASDLQKANRKAVGWVGRGKYDLLKSSGRFTRSLGNLALSKVSGMGLYGGQGSYTDNQLIAGGRDSSAFYGANDETDEIIITDTEFVADIYAPSITANTSSSFAQQTLSCNPGLPTFAASLSQLACNYTEYEMVQLVYELRPVISESNVNNGITGVGMMVFNYNPNDDPYDNKEDVMQAHGSVSAKLNERMRMGVECDPKKTRSVKGFIRTGPVPYGKDNDEYDIGVLTIATNNIPSAFSNMQIFELYVSYTVKLRKRKSGALRLLNQQRDIFTCGNDVSYTNLFNAQFVGSYGGVLYGQQNSIGGQLGSTQNRNLTYTFPPNFNGIVEVDLIIDGSGIACQDCSITGGGNVFNLFDIYGGNPTSNDTPQTIAFVASSTGIMVKGHYRVRSVTGGTANTLSLFLTMTAGTIQSWSYTIQEYTCAFFQSKKNPAPIFMNIIDGSLQTGIV